MMDNYIKNEKFFQIHTDDMVDSEELTYITQFRGEYKNAKVKKRKQYNIRKKNRKNQIDIMTLSIYYTGQLYAKLKRNENKCLSTTGNINSYYTGISNFLNSEKTISDIKSLYQTIEDLINFIFDENIDSHGQPYFVRHNTIIRTIIDDSPHSYVLFFIVKPGEKSPIVKPLISTNRICINKDHRIYYDPTTDHVIIYDFTYLFDICTGFMYRLNNITSTGDSIKSICIHGNYIMKFSHSEENHALRLRYKCIPVTIQDSFITLINNEKLSYSNTFHKYADQTYNKDIYLYNHLCFCILTLNNGSTVELEGDGELTSSMISPYQSTLVSAVIGKSCTNIGYEAFNRCDSLKSITIYNSVTSIGNYAFNYCSSLTSITIPDSVTSIGNCAFSFCTALTTITIPDSVTSIGYNALNGCISLESITIPDSVTSIGNSAFSGCTGLTSITSLATTAPTIQNTTFQNVKTGGILTVPGGSTGYDTWMSTSNYYLGLYDWTIEYIGQNPEPGGPSPDN